MADATITIPGNPTNIHLERGDTLTIIFARDSIIVVHHGHSLRPPLQSGLHRQGTEAYEVDTDKDTIIIEYKDDDHEEARATKMHTITIGTGLELFEELRKEVVPSHGTDADSLFCKCWPCAQAVLEFLLKSTTFPIPLPVKTFLTALVKAGELAHAVFCEKKDR